MSDLIEISEFTTGIYQIETNDDVLGGENGIANTQAKALANRTLWLKNQLALKALKNGSALNLFKVKDAVAEDEAVSKKQVEELLNQVPTVPTGLVVANPSLTIPAGFLECNGAVLSRITYADLFAVIGTTYGAGDGSTTFNLPDLRGEFIRGFDNGRGVDNGRGIGSYQLGTLVASEADGHFKYGFTVGSSTVSPTFENTKDELVNFNEYSSTLSLRYQEFFNVSPLTQNYVGVSRPRNIAMMYCIKY